MASPSGTSGVHPLWWTAGLFTLIAAVIATTAIMFTGALRQVVTITVTADRSGLVMDAGSKVKMRGLQVGRVADVRNRPDATTIALQLDPHFVQYIPANVTVSIEASTIFGAKVVNLIYPDVPASRSIAAGATLPALSVTTEVNTAFENLLAVVDRIEPRKLNAVLSALAEGLRGKGDRIGEATTDFSEVLTALNARMDTLDTDFTSLAAASDTYAAAAPDLLATLAALPRTAQTITAHADDLQATLLGAIGLSRSGTDLLGPSKDTIVRAINGLAPTTDLLMKYKPEITCTLQGAGWVLDPAGGNGDLPNGGNGYSAVLDVALGLTVDPYRFPDNLPIVAAKGGPGGKPSCGGLPRPDLDFPVRALVTNTGYGTGLDWRPNPGIAHPWFKNYFPTTRAVPEEPYVLGGGPPAIGPVTYPGAPPFGAPLFGSDGSPLWAPPPPGVPPPPVPGVAVAPPPYGPPGPSDPVPGPVQP